ncbi:hypothetical protein ALP29_201405 [Pseudomonas syringae pv. avii]|uniref:Uncharacterized protein n=1 Tax=Pseudomonas syringae pv. avii TaxID=663959 RepID=A0A3M5VNA8_PSESX|nr:hypothetical protein ALP29_201405 [Pseudomonas syringae pv. avii]
MRFIDNQKGNRHLSDEVTEALILEPLDRDHQDFQFPGARPGHDVRDIIPALRRIDARRRNAMPMQKGKLILNQRQQR